MFAKSLLALGALAALVSPELALARPLVGRYEVPTPAPIARDDTSTCKVVTVTVDDTAATSTALVAASTAAVTATDDTSTCKIVTVTADDSAATSNVRLFFRSSRHA